MTKSDIPKLALSITDVPDALRSHFDRLRKALSTSVPGAWPEEPKPTYLEADQPRMIGTLLVDTIHRHLQRRKIGYLFREDMKSRDKINLGLASKVGGKVAFFSSLEFLIEINWSRWKYMGAAQRVALIDHELCHFGIEETDAGDKLVLLSHDVEEFGAIVQRWGLWKADLRDFARITAQRDLFADGPAAAPADEPKRGKRPPGKRVGDQFIPEVNKAGEPLSDEGIRELLLKAARDVPIDAIASRTATEQAHAIFWARAQLRADRPPHDNPAEPEWLLKFAIPSLIQDPSGAPHDG